MESRGRGDLAFVDWLNSYFAFTPSFLDALRDATYRVILLGADRYNPPLWTMKVEFIGSLITFAFYTLMPAQGLWRKGIHYAIAILTIGILAGQGRRFLLRVFVGRPHLDTAETTRRLQMVAARRRLVLGIVSVRRFIPLDARSGGVGRKIYLTAWPARFWCCGRCAPACATDF